MVPEWNPMSDELRAFKIREIDLCKNEIRKSKGTLRHTETLFSKTTWEKANAELGIRV